MVHDVMLCGCYSPRKGGMSNPNVLGISSLLSLGGAHHTWLPVLLHPRTLSFEPFVSALKNLGDCRAVQSIGFGKA